MPKVREFSPEEAARACEERLTEPWTGPAYTNEEYQELKKAGKLDKLLKKKEEAK